MGVVAAAALAFGGLTMSTSYAADDATIYVVQGLPGQNLDVAVDGKTVAENVKTAAVAGPFTVKAGSRKITFSDGGDTVVGVDVLGQGQVQLGCRGAPAGSTLTRIRW